MGLNFRPTFLKNIIYYKIFYYLHCIIHISNVIMSCLERVCLKHQSYKILHHQNTDFFIVLDYLQGYCY